MTDDFTASNGHQVGVDSPTDGRPAGDAHDSPAAFAPEPHTWTGTPHASQSYQPADAELRAVVSAVYGPSEPAQWQLDNARNALIAVHALRQTERNRT